MQVNQQSISQHPDFIAARADTRLTPSEENCLFAGTQSLFLKQLARLATQQQSQHTTDAGSALEKRAVNYA